MKATKNWEWENIWLAFTFLGLVVLPVLVASATVPHLGEVLRTSPARSLMSAALLGLGWGCGSACFGVGVKMVGMGLAFSLVAGLSGAMGSLIPWFTAPNKSLSYSGLLWLGVLVMVGGVAVCALAGRERERKVGSDSAATAGHREFGLGLTVCILGGILSCFMNLGFVYGAEVANRARQLGASEAAAPNVLWMVVMSGGFVANALYCGRLLITRGSWRGYLAPTTTSNCAWILLMALIWEGNLVAYAEGANRIGNLGPSVGWPIVLSMTLITSNIWGAGTAEWQGAGGRAIATMVAGITLLVLAVAILGWASTKA
jgi:L-rhamnose-H+ transport protein